MPKFEIDVAVKGENKVDSLEKKVKRTDRAADKLAGTFKKLGGVLAGIFISGQIVSKFNETAAAIDKIAKTSQRLGLTVAAFKGLALAANQTGVSTETLGQAIQRMNRRVFEASRGTGEAKQALRDLGLVAEDLVKLSPDETFLAIADSMAKLTNTGEKTALMMKIFDSEGVALKNTMEGGAGAIRAFITEQEKLGVLTQSQVKDVEEMNDGFQKLGLAIAFVGEKFTADLAPDLKQIAESFTVAVTESKVFKDALSGIADIIAVVAKTLAVMVQSINFAAEGYKLLFNAIFGTEEAFQAQLETVGKLSDAMKELFEEPEGADAQINVTKQVTQEFEKQVTLWDEIQRASRDYYLEMNANTKIANDLVQSLSSTMVDGIAGGFRKMLDGANDWGDTMKSIIKDIIAQLIKVLVVQQAINALAGAIGGSSGTSSPSGARASGGPVIGQRSYLVGEKGPELFTPSQSGSITSNDKLGASVNVNVVNNSNASVDVQQDGDNISVIIEQVSNAIASGISRNTSPVGNAVQSSFGLSR